MDNINNCYSENYLCDICDCEFTNFSKFLSHSIHEHGIPEDEISYDCANCYQSFTLLTNFQEHIVKKSWKTSEIQSEKCAEIVFIKEVFKKSDDSDIEYEFDNETNKEEFESDDENNYEEQHYKCDLCEKNFFNSSFLLKSHLSEAHKRVAAEIEKLTEIPKECKKHTLIDRASKVAKYIDLEVHKGQKKFHPEENHLPVPIQNYTETETDINTDAHKDYKCDSCGKAFTSFNSLEIHLHRVHDGYKDYNCESCGKSFTTAKYLKKHIRRLHEHHKCESCGKSFTGDWSLRFHIKVIHEGCKDHECKSCGKTFPQPNILKAHIYTFHEGHKDYSCEYCGKSFSKKGTLKQHIESVHDHKKYKCDYCGKSSSKKSNLKKHIHTIHEGHKDYKCETCGILCSRAENLKKHIRTVHEGHKDYKCKSCAKSFTESNSLRKHIPRRAFVTLFQLSRVCRVCIS